MTERVFGYASLTALAGRPATVTGLRRVWGVAMDNRVAIPGYKRYLDPATGEPPAVFVAFLDVVEETGSSVDGVLLEVTDLAALDARERNYERVALNAGVEPAWTYVGSAAGRARFAAGVESGTLVVDAAYLELAGPCDPPPCPVVALERVEL